METVPLRHPYQTIPSSSQPLAHQKLSQHQQPEKSQKHFPSYLDAYDLSPRARAICEILARVFPAEVETALSVTGMNLEPEVVQEVIKFSYGCPEATMIFFKWVGLKQKHSPLTWNLIVDLLGKNQMFERMWEAIRSMTQEGVVSITTFVSAFRSYCEVGRFNEAIKAFDAMEKYGIQPDVVALNSLLSAICREHFQTEIAAEFFEKIKTKIPPDADSFAILLEGWEKEGNVAKAKTMFAEMVIRVGWSPENMSAYVSFLNTLIQDSQADEALKFLHVMKGKNCLPGLKFFSNALDVLNNQNDSAHALSLWEIMTTNGLIPNLVMYNSIITLLCKKDEITNAYQLLDEMPFNGVFPNSLTYNIIFECLIKNKKVKETGNFFLEMIKNEQPPTPSNCASAISMFFELDDPEMGFEIWFYMMKDGVSPLEDSANALLIGLASMGRLTELRRYVEQFFLKGIKIYESTMGKLKIAFLKEGRKGVNVYTDLDWKWRSS
ncbi:pentatricopeptide repeat-containing protein At1g77360, mitochondrial [Lactuca sativa]|uniref:Pentacotripeptide-repeat region of PRORP domain-containing protein n=1 Tax=Lactuca sativa TaxID=4236 RepID=A0A9R1V7V2_LACSA|nr:pentatricopeptide repeat-containing protein At1g77360, mitochondrial [Lactuca sativa]KAJ0199908.1 hypothetical protein LSAT_V11C600327000 [Lactuca sativa]